MVQRVFRWERQERWSGRKRQGPMSEKCHFKNVLMNLPFMCLNYIVAHETYQQYLALPFKPAYTCFIKQRGTSRTQEFKCRFVFWSTSCNVWHLEACNIPLERSWKYLSNSILYAPKFLKTTVEKEKRKIHSRLVTVDQGGQKKRNGKSSNINYQRIEI